MSQHYSNPKRADEPHALPDVNVYYNDADGAVDDNGAEYPIGWYWDAQFPGCLPDGEPNGPFETEADAVADAQADYADDDDVDEDEQVEDEPSEDDYYLSDNERSILYYGKVIAGPVRLDAAPCPQDAVMRKLAAYVVKSGYYPNVWKYSDHGNPSLISVQACGCYFTEHIGLACDRKNAEGGV